MSFLKVFLFLLLLLPVCLEVKAQRVERIFFNLYTDSLKKEVYNYINVDAKLSDGSFLPLTSDELIFESSAGKWDRNSLVIDNGFQKDSIVITARLKADSSITKTTTVYLKKLISEDKLKTKDEIFYEIERGSGRKHE